MGKISTLGVLRLRATSAVARDKSVRRCAQDDDFVGVLKKNIPNKLALMGRSLGLSSAVPQGPRSPRVLRISCRVAGVGELHAAFLNESRARGCWWRPVQEIRIRGPKKMAAAPTIALATGTHTKPTVPRTRATHWSIPRACRAPAFSGCSRSNSCNTSLACGLSFRSAYKRARLRYDWSKPGATRMHLLNSSSALA